MERQGGGRAIIANMVITRRERERGTWLMYANLVNTLSLSQSLPFSPIISMYVNVF
jgi:hypothetical protein